MIFFAFKGSLLMPMYVVEKKITKSELSEVAKERFGDLYSFQFNHISEIRKKAPLKNGADLDKKEFRQQSVYRPCN